MSSSTNKNIIRRTTDSLFIFFALYLTTLFSFDTWNAARGSPYRLPSADAFYRPAQIPPAPDSYQGRMHGRGNAGPSRGPRTEGRIKHADTRAPMPLFGTAKCGACMS